MIYKMKNCDSRVHRVAPESPLNIHVYIIILIKNMTRGGT